MTLHYTFPIIRHINDVAPHIVKRPEFICVQKDGGYTVVNYVYQDSDTFPSVTDDASAILRECRGLIFETATGRIASRRFHKFFNLGEKPDTVTVDVSKPHHVLDKLDGSMISPLFVSGGIRWVSKMGVTDVSMQAETFVATHPHYERFAAHCIGRGVTPIFEWMSRRNRIVLDYGDDTLTLIAARRNEQGTYLPRKWLVEASEEYGFPLVQAVSPALSSLSFVEELRKREGVEGIVITFDDGHMVKVKTDWYVQLHRAKDQIARERHLIALILNDKIDDLLPALPESDRARVEKFSVALNHDLTVFGEAVLTVMRAARTDAWDRKTFALRSEFYHRPVRAACFHMFDEPDALIARSARDWGRVFVLKNLGSPGAVERAREVLFTARWEETTE